MNKQRCTKIGQPITGFAFGRYWRGTFAGFRRTADGWRYALLKTSKGKLIKLPRKGQTLID